MVDEREPALNGVRVAPGNPRLPWTIQPLLNIRYQEERGDNKVVEQNRWDALVIVLGARRLPLDERVVDLDPRWRAQSCGVEDSYGTFYGARYALYEDDRGDAVEASRGDTTSQRRGRAVWQATTGVSTRQVEQMPKGAHEGLM